MPKIGDSIGIEDVYCKTKGVFIFLPDHEAEKKKSIEPFLWSSFQKNTTHTHMPASYISITFEK